MGCFTVNNNGGISTRKAGQMRMGIALGEVSYNSYVKGDLKAARKVMVKASKLSKYTYLSALHTLANYLTCASR